MHHDPNGYQIIHNLDDDMEVVIGTTKMELGRIAIAIASDMLQSFDRNLPHFNPNMFGDSRRLTVGVLRRDGYYRHWRTQGLFLRMVTQVWAQFPDQTTLAPQDHEVVFKVLRFLQQVADLVDAEMRAQNGEDFGSSIPSVQLDEFVTHLQPA